MEAVGGVCEFCVLCCCEFFASGLVNICCELMCSLGMCRNSNEPKRNNENAGETADPNYIHESQELLDLTRTSGMQQRNETNQTADVWNISGRVNQDSGVITSEHQRWPTHEHHINMNSYAFPDSVQSPLKDRLPPPPYTEVDLPSYEQATGNPKPKTDLVNVHITPQQRSSTSAAAGTSS